MELLIYSNGIYFNRCCTTNFPCCLLDMFVWTIVVFVNNNKVGRIGYSEFEFLILL